MKILTVIGARPQFIKAAPLSREFLKHPEIHEEVVHTGQHYDARLSDVFFSELGIPEPVCNLGVHATSHGTMTAEMLVGLEKEIVARKPDWILVYGDTNSTLAGALAAAKLHVPVVHVEAGERSFNRRMPEEINRILVDRISRVLFCSSHTALQHLKNEGVESGAHFVGDLMRDAFRVFEEKAEWPSEIPRGPELQSPYALVTFHRAQNTDDPVILENILKGLSELPVQILLPLHPRTRAAIEKTGLTIPSNFTVVAPQSYFSLLSLLKNCAFVVTDSGGLQKEAYYAGKKCIVIREETEWDELVAADAVKLVGTDPQKIVASLGWANTPSSQNQAIYGDGHTAEKITQILLGIKAD